MALIRAEHLVKTYRAGEVEVPAVKATMGDVAYDRLKMWVDRQAERCARRLLPAGDHRDDERGRSQLPGDAGAHVYVANLELKLRLFILSGGSSSDFGEKQNARKLEVYALYYF